ncbi:MAG: hypothetical protein MJD61_16895 [Proteobacteria bacterium]|nr:hypothetical protein [Pseudomonadota bacterium]
MNRKNKMHSKRVLICGALLCLLAGGWVACSSNDDAVGGEPEVKSTQAGLSISDVWLPEGDYCGTFEAWVTADLWHWVKVILTPGKWDNSNECVPDPDGHVVEYKVPVSPAKSGWVTFHGSPACGKDDLNCTCDSSPNCMSGRTHPEHFTVVSGDPKWIDVPINTSGHATLGGATVKIKSEIAPSIVLFRAEAHAVVTDPNNGEKKEHIPHGCEVTVDVKVAANTKAALHDTSKLDDVWVHVLKPDDLPAPPQDACDLSPADNEGVKAKCEAITGVDGKLRCTARVYLPVDIGTFDGLANEWPYEFKSVVRVAAKDESVKNVETCAFKELHVNLPEKSDPTKPGVNIETRVVPETGSPETYVWLVDKDHDHSPELQYAAKVQQSDAITPTAVTCWLEMDSAGALSVQQGDGCTGSADCQDDPRVPNPTPTSVTQTVAGLCVYRPFKKCVDLDGVRAAPMPAGDGKLHWDVALWEPPNTKNKPNNQDGLWDYGLFDAHPWDFPTDVPTNADDSTQWLWKDPIADLGNGNNQIDSGELTAKVATGMTQPSLEPSLQLEYRCPVSHPEPISTH